MKLYVKFQDAREEGREEGREERREEGREEGRVEGLAKGRADRDREKITEMLLDGKKIKEISEFCNYPYDLVKEIADSLKKSEKV